jgi:hypothetical protein
MKMHIAIEVKVNVASVITALSGFVFIIAVELNRSAVAVILRNSPEWR